MCNVLNGKLYKPQMVEWAIGEGHGFQTAARWRRWGSEITGCAYCCKFVIFLELRFRVKKMIKIPVFPDADQQSLCVNVWTMTWKTWAFWRLWMRQQLRRVDSDGTMQRRAVCGPWLTPAVCFLWPWKNVPAQFNEIMFHAKGMCCNADENLMGIVPEKIVRKWTNVFHYDYQINKVLTLVIREGLHWTLLELIIWRIRH